MRARKAVNTANLSDFMMGTVASRMRLHKVLWHLRGSDMISVDSSGQISQAARASTKSGSPLPINQSQF